jgi:hypothetical protein
MWLINFGWFEVFSALIWWNSLLLNPANQQP